MFDVTADLPHLVFLCLQVVLPNSECDLKVFLLSLTWMNEVGIVLAVYIDAYISAAPVEHLLDHPIEKVSNQKQQPPT
jgi:hypothetical protein